MIIDAIHTLLNNVDADNYPNEAPQNQDVPYTVFRFAGLDPSNTKTDASTIDFHTLIIDIYASTPRGAETLAASIRAALDYYSGTVGGDIITSIIFEDQAGDVDFSSDFHNVRQTYRVRLST